jgi:formylglycine-generating enzyme required for sulfatase activity
MSTYGLAAFSLDPVGPAAGVYRVSRGGSWCDYARSARGAVGHRLFPGYRYNYFGFRLTRTIT